MAAKQVKSKCWPPMMAVALSLAVAAGGCEQSSEPGQGTTRLPDVPYEPTPQSTVAEMLKLAQVGPNDVVYDLGCGDGRIVITAVKQFGARGVCVDIDPQRTRESRANARRAGIAERIVFLTQDLFDTDIGNATVVTLFLWPDVNLKLRPKLWRELAPGTRVVSYVHDMGDWKPQESRTVDSPRGPRKLFLWITPADGMERANPRSVPRLAEQEVDLQVSRQHKRGRRDAHPGRPALFSAAEDFHLGYLPAGELKQQCAATCRFGTDRDVLLKIPWDHRF